MSECLSADLELELKKKKKRAFGAGEGVEKKKPSYTVGGTHVGVVTVENRMELPEKTKTRITM